jgi:protein SCO1/2
VIDAASARHWAGRPTALVVPIALGLAIVLAGAFAWSTGRLVSLPGTELDARPSPDFVLTDHRGVELRLSDLRGRPVVLAFLFAGCPDVCLLTTAGMAETARQVPEAAFVGISVDPSGDDPSTVRRFLARQGLGDRLVYLTGPTPALERAWADYFVYADAAMHTDAIYLIDREGRQRALLRSDFDPAELTAALRSLL